MANLITNPDLSTTVTNWSGSRATTTRVEASAVGIPVPTGTLDSWVLEVATTLGQTDGQAYTPAITVESGAYYILSVRVYCPYNNPSKLGATILVVDASYNTVVQKSITIFDEWVTVAIGFLAATTTIRVLLRDNAGAATPGKTYFDGIALNKVTLGGELYFDSSVAYSGDGSSKLAAPVPGGAGAFKYLAPVSAFSGVSAASKRDLLGTKFLMHEASVFRETCSLSNAYNFTVNSYGSLGIKPLIDLTSPFTKTWTEESPGLWYADADPYRAYSRRFVVNGEKLYFNKDKSDLASGSYKSWYDSANSRHYIVINGLLNPNDCTIYAGDNYYIRQQGILLTSCYDWIIYGIISKYGSLNNISASGTGDTWSVTDCEVIGAGGCPGSQDGILVYGSGYGGTCVPATNGVISGNKSSENQNNGIELWGCSGTLVNNNELIGDSGGLELWGYVTNSTITRNLIIDTISDKGSSVSGSRGLWGTGTDTAAPNTGHNSNNFIASNIIGKKQKNAVIIEQGTGWKVYNNMLLPCTGEAVGGKTLSLTNCSVEVTNNIVIANGIYGSSYIGSVSGNVTLTGNSNCFYCVDGTPAIFYNGTSYKSFADFKVAVSQDGSINENPLLVDIASGNYRLQPTSPCLNTGTAVTGVTVDFDGNQHPSPNGTSIGPYEDYPPPKEGFGPWVHFDDTSFTPPVALANGSIATVEQVATFTGTPPTSQIDKVMTLGET